ncbi:hypothetical protein CYLTODRAFT_485840 [Cylindrobasidium torrendii FP15055 ss-10]|uniref:Uncharacterized protein n=1 Tax=Cylindrobasidium torrendii FP15055 ss-10 TaxID=1314674 RepID=A0A0D7BS92_9AGAR|nr:hypothetical protein CYLTODRAFT_485840 [Cylindrobasidium torrendii FP15055 ss-10]
MREDSTSIQEAQVLSPSRRRTLLLLVGVIVAAYTSFMLALQGIQVGILLYSTGYPRQAFWLFGFGWAHSFVFLVATLGILALVSRIRLLVRCFIPLVKLAVGALASGFAANVVFLFIDSSGILSSCISISKVYADFDFAYGFWFPRTSTPPTVESDSEAWCANEWRISFLGVALQAGVILPISYYLYLNVKEWSARNCPADEKEEKVVNTV